VVTGIPRPSFSRRIAAIRSVRTSQRGNSDKIQLTVRNDQRRAVSGRRVGGGVLVSVFGF
jgi:hypothetical protein